MYYRSRARVGPRFSRTYTFTLVLLALAVAGGLYVTVRMVFAGRPRIGLSAPFDVVGRNRPLVVEVNDHAHGLSWVRVAVEQGNARHVVYEESFASPRPQVQVRWVPGEEKRFRLQDGMGRVVAEARNKSWGNFFRGKTAAFQKDFTAQLVPPRVEVLTAQHYVNQGGCDMVVYKVTPADAESGVLAGERFFPGHPMPGAPPGVHFAVFAYPYDAGPDLPIRLRARDKAENEVLAGFTLKVFPKTFRNREIPLHEAFLNKVVPEIVSQADLRDQGDLLKNYLQINRDLRQKNNADLAALTQRSRPQFLWSEPFKQLGSSQVEAQFADHRTYLYKGEAVDIQDHLGFDLATTANAPVTASNAGVVVLAEYFGIYGNTVVIDHGYGLMSLYGHLSSFGVKEGDTVTRGQALGRSGATGLAGGDHLHFSMLLRDVQVDPREWWDPHWIEDRVAAKLRQFGSGAGPGKAPAPSPPPAGRRRPAR
ncbi:MAG TPA: M23 family metallopeptidase [Vicinamibacteria bacterium]